MGEQEGRFSRAIVKGPEQREDFDLGTGSLEGLVRMPDGSPARHVSLSLSAPLESGFPPRTVGPDSAGRFHFAFLEANTYTLRVGHNLNIMGQKPKGFALYRSGEIELQLGQSITGLEIQLTEPGSVTGLVLAANGTPAPDEFLIAEDKDGLKWSRYPLAQSDRNGRFTIHGLPEGPVVITTYQGQGEALPKDVAGGTTDIVLQLDG